jgi:WD domain, G-beta repeat
VGRGDWARVADPRGAHFKYSSVAFSPNGRTALSGSQDSTLKLWDVATGRQLRNLVTGHAEGVSTVAFSPDGRTAMLKKSGASLRPPGHHLVTAACLDVVVTLARLWTEGAAASGQLSAVKKSLSRRLELLAKTRNNLKPRVRCSTAPRGVKQRGSPEPHAGLSLLPGLSIPASPRGAVDSSFRPLALV